MKIVAIYKGNGKTLDNITVITDDRDVMRGTVAYLGTDETDGQAFSQWGELNERDICRLSNDKTRLIFSRRNHLGTLTRFENLPRLLQKHLAERILL